MAAGAMCSQDIFVEVSYGPALTGNNILLSKAALRLSTEVAGFVSILHGDNCICSNIFRWSHFRQMILDVR